MWLVVSLEMKEYKKMRIFWSESEEEMWPSMEEVSRWREYFKGVLNSKGRRELKLFVREKFSNCRKTGTFRKLPSFFFFKWKGT